MMVKALDEMKSGLEAAPANEPVSKHEYDLYYFDPKVHKVMMFISIGILLLFLGAFVSFIVFG